MWRLTSRPESQVEIWQAGLACCALEVEAAVARGLLERVGPGDHGPETDEAGPTLLVVAGTVTKALEPAVLAWCAEHSKRGPVEVVSFGACSISGGPYWDAPTVQNGIDVLLPISSYVPGCPPRPEALVAELEKLIDRSSSGGAGTGGSG